MLSINACDVDLIAVMCNTVNDSISQRTCFSSELIIPFFKYMLRTEDGKVFFSFGEIAVNRSLYAGVSDENYHISEDISEKKACF